MGLFILIIQTFFMVGHLLSDHKSSKIGAASQDFVELIKWKVRFAVGLVVLEILYSIVSGVFSVFIFVWIIILVIDIVQLIDCRR